jgi:hypothetical protein
MRIYIEIQSGDDRAGAPYFIYDARLANYAAYDITGTALDSDVHFDGVKD